MKSFHTPAVDARYWLGITLASIFGTNLGDLYAHESGLGIYRGIAVLATLAAAVFAAERFDRRPRELYYWAVILIIRTGATNIADYLAFRVRVQPLLLTLSLAALIGVFAVLSARLARGARRDGSPETNAPYWVAMLAAGTFGTVLGDICSHVVGQGTASIGLGLLLAVTLFIGRGGRAFVPLAAYWLTIAVARTAGTAMGDWLAENHILHIGLTVATVMTGLTFVAVLAIWPQRQKSDLAEIGETAGASV